MSSVIKNPSSGFSNLDVQLQKMARGLKLIFWKKRDGAIYVAKTKALIRCAVAAQLICAFVFTHMQNSGFLMTRLVSLSHLSFLFRGAVVTIFLQH